MRRIYIMCIILIISCASKRNREHDRMEIYQTEKAFEKTAKEKGIAEAFYQFADLNAVIKRVNDTLIVGNEQIKNYYSQLNNQNVTVHWEPDFIDLSDDGTMGYSYGKYRWIILNPDSSESIKEGVFHTVWKKQTDGSWRYVWD